MEVRSSNNEEDRESRGGKDDSKRKNCTAGEDGVQDNSKGQDNLAFDEDEDEDERNVSKGDDGRVPTKEQVDNRDTSNNIDVAMVTKEDDNHSLSNGKDNHAGLNNGVDNPVFNNDDEINRHDDAKSSPDLNQDATTCKDPDAGLNWQRERVITPATGHGDAPVEKRASDTATNENGRENVAKANKTKSTSDSGSMPRPDDKKESESRKTENQPVGDKKSKPDDKNNLVFLDQNLNLLHCVSFILGSIIGTDIFFTPQGVLTNSGSTGVTILIWIICGIGCLLAAACYAELATTFRKSGGEFTFLYTAFGDRPAYVQVWMALIIGRTGGMAMMTMGFGSLLSRVLYSGCGAPPDYMINLLAAVTLSKLKYSFLYISTLLEFEFTFLYTAFGDRPAYVQVWMVLIIGRTGGMAMMAMGFGSLLSRVLYSGCGAPPDYMINLLAAVTLSLLVFINFINVRWAILLQVVFTAIKLLAVLLIIVAGFVYIIQGRSRSLDDVLGSPSDVTPSLIPVALYRGLYAYSGWQTLGFLTEEVKNPNRTIPLAMLISLPLVTTLYCLITIVYASVLSPDQIMNSQAVAIIYARVVLGKWFWIISPLVALSMLSSINGTIMAGSRMFLVASREQKAPEWWSMISIRWRSPLPALLTLLSVALIMIPIHRIAVVLGWLYSFLWVSVGAACGVIPIMRHRQPKLHRPFMVPSAFPFICIVFCAFALAMSLYLDARACGLTLAFAVSGFVVRRILEQLMIRTLWFPKSLDKITLFVQRLLLIVHQEKKTY